jgi:Helix-loop-helix DNA-binding domain
MPHTRAARLAALKEASESREMFQMQNSTLNIGWDDFLDWDMPVLTHHPHYLAWFLNEGVASDQPQVLTDTQSFTADAATCLPEPNHEHMSNSNFCGLQPWYSSEMQEFSSVSSAATTRPQLSRSEFDSFRSNSFDEESQAEDSSYGSHTLSPNIDRQLSSVSDGVFPRTPSDSLGIDLTEEPDEPPSRSSEDETVLRRDTARVDANKKRKIAHRVIEKNYRSRIKDCMVQLRDCVPSTAKSRSSLESKRPGSQQGAEDTALNRSSGKVATLSDAVQYVKSLELQNEALHGRLDVMQRRNNTLQKIALSKVHTNAPAMTISVEELDEEDVQGNREGGKNKHARKRSKQRLLDRGCSHESVSRRVARDEVRAKAVAHAPGQNKRYGSVSKSVTRTLAAIRISEELIQV